MRRRILLALDESMNSRQALHYTARTFAGRADMEFELLHIQPILSDYLVEEARKDPKAFRRLEQAMARHAEQAERMLDACRERMVRDGVSADRITLTSRPRRIGLAKDILDHGREGMFDAIAVGRRGLSRMQKLFMGSTSLKLIEHTDFLPVWMVDREKPLRKILVAVDGSRTSIKLVEHVGLVLADRKDVSVTLYHATSSGLDVPPEAYFDTDDIGGILVDIETRMITRFLSDAVEILSSAGIPLGKIRIETPKTEKRAGRAILDTVESGGYDTVVMGRRGVGRSFYFGSVSRYIAERMHDRTLWLVP